MSSIQANLPLSRHAPCSRTNESRLSCHVTTPAGPNVVPKLPPAAATATTCWTASHVTARYLAAGIPCTTSGKDGRRSSWTSVMWLWGTTMAMDQVGVHGTRHWYAAWQRKRRGAAPLGSVQGQTRRLGMTYEDQEESGQERTSTNTRSHVVFLFHFLP